MDREKVLHRLKDVAQALMCLEHLLEKLAEDITHDDDYVSITSDSVCDTINDGTSILKGESKIWNTD